MARLYPTQIPDDAAGSEKRVLEALRDRLDDDYTVVWSVGTLSKSDTGKLEVGEADIVLLHPVRGLLVLEVKGGAIGYDASARAYRSTNQYGRDHVVKDPYDQASGRARDLVGKIEALGIGGSHDGIACAWGYGVVFPDCRIGNVTLPPNALRDVSLDVSDLDFLDSRIEAIFRHWATGRNIRPLRDEEYRAIRERVLMPDFRLAYSLSAEMANGQRRIVQLTDEQCRILDGLDEIDRALVRGPAGTGKTFLLVEKAKRLADSGRRVLILCFNRPLSEHLAALCEDTGACGDTMTFHHMCRLVIENAGGLFKPPEHNAGEFWRSEAPNRMYEALDSYPNRWDAVLVDEGQDFDSTWWACVEGVLADDAAFYIFYDSAQQLYDVQSAFPFDEPTVLLKNNCRNTANICRLLQAYAPGVDIRYTCNAPQGRLPSFIRCDGPGQDLQSVDRLVNHLVAREGISPRDIVLLSPHRLAHSAFCGRKKIGQYPLLEWEERGQDGILFSSISRYKGLESDVVILVDITGDTDQEKLYTAYSRARQLLYVFHDASYVVPEAEYLPKSQLAPMP